MDTYVEKFGRVLRALLANVNICEQEPSCGQSLFHVTPPNVLGAAVTMVCSMKAAQELGEESA